MDLNPTPEQGCFAEELREWLKSNLPWECGIAPAPIADLAERVAQGRVWQVLLATQAGVAGRWRS